LKFIVTARQFAGLAPPGTLVGDAVVIIDCEVVPFVVRNNSGALAGARLLVGECFLDGLMSGEEGSLGVAEEMIRVR
jgi:hypothetical protein